MSGQLHALASLPQENCPRYRLDRRIGGLQGLFASGSEEKVTAPAGTRTPVVHSLATRLNHYTDWAAMAIDFNIWKQRKKARIRKND